MTTMGEWGALQRRRAATRKGDDFEARAVAFYIRMGFAVEQVRINRQMIFRGGRSGWITTKADFFGCFDLICLHQTLAPELVQCTSDPGEASRKRRKIDMRFQLPVAGANLVVCVPGESPNDLYLWIRELPAKWIGPISAMNRLHNVRRNLDKNTNAR